MKKEKISIKTRHGNMKVLVLNRNENKDKLVPGLLWIHGGGYATGNTWLINFTMGKALAKKFGAVVISPDYRKSKEAPYPAAFEDCCDALSYMYKNAKELGIDPNRIVVGGESAGGGLAAAICLYERDEGHIPITFQIPLYPMLDSNDTESSKDNHGHIWNTKRNHICWKLYLKELYNTDKVPKYASPSREKDYRNLPPCYTYVEDGEPFYCETLKYVDDLKKANVKAKVDVFKGKTHSFDAFFWTKNAKKAKENLFKEVKPYLE